MRDARVNKEITEADFSKDTAQSVAGVYGCTAVRGRQNLRKF